MATINKYIDTDLGTDSAEKGGSAGAGAYKSLAYAESQNRQNLVTGTNIIIFNCVGTAADTDAVSFSGVNWTTSSSYYIVIQGDAHTGIYDTAHYRLELDTSEADGLILTNVEIHLDKVQFQSTVTAYGYPLVNIYGTTAKNVWISNCIFKGVITAGCDCCAVFTSSGSENKTVYIWDCLFIDFNGAGTNSEVRSCIQVYSACLFYIYSCTFSDCYAGLHNQYDNDAVTMKNCLFNNCTKDVDKVSGATTILDSYCATTNDNTKGLTAAGTGHRFSQTFTFVTGVDNFHLASDDGGARNYGTTTSGEGAPLNFTTDIDGETRSGTWDIGFDEYTAAAGGFSSGGSLKHIVMEW